MPGRGHRVLKGYVKWFLIPLAISAIGFFLVGPRLSTIPPQVANSLKGVIPDTPNASSQEKETEGSKKKYPEPEVKVTTKSVHRGSRSHN